MMAAAESFEARLEQVRERVAAATARSGRAQDEIEILPITKGQPLAAVRAAYSAGFRRVGENRVGEGSRKMDELRDLSDLRWDMVGHIQSRKSGDVAAGFDRVHSIDRMKIARHLNRDAAESNRTLQVLIECNVSGEESKYGWPLSDPEKWQDILEPFSEILGMERLEVQGLMTMAPWIDDDEVVRTTFQRLRRLRDYLRQELPQSDWRELSMGMTDDYELAVEEGATILRLGRALFGERES